MNIKKSPQTTGSDTRLYNPRSESDELIEGNSDRDENVSYGPGDPSSDEKQNEAKKLNREEREKKWAGLQHIKIQSAKPVEEEPFAESTPQDDQAAINDQTSGNSGEAVDGSTGARTGTGSALGEIPPQLPTMGAFGQTAKGDPMDMAWTDIHKVLGDPVGTSTLESVDRARRSGRSIGSAKPRSAHRIKAFPRPIGGRSPWASTKRRASVHQRLFGNIKGRGGKSIRSKSKTGMMRQPYSLSPHHLGVGVMWGKPRPGRLEDPGKYLSWLGRQSAYRGAGGSGVMLPYTPHAPREQLGQLGFPGSQGSGRQRMLPGASQLAREGPRRATRGPPQPKGMGRGGAPSPLASSASASPLASMFGKADMKELVEVSKAYVRQLGPGLSHIDMGDFKDLLRELKHLLSQLPRKSLMGIAAGGNNAQGQVHAPANGPVQVSAPTGATETDPEDLPEYWGADPSQLTRRGGVRHA